MDKPQVKVTIHLSFDLDNLSDWLMEWENIRDKLIEMAGIDDAKIEIPEGIKEIELSRY